MSERERKTARLKPAVELPMLGTPRCPAAIPIAGAMRSQQGVVCTLMRDDQDDDPGVDMTAGDVAKTRRGVGGVYLNLKSDPSTVLHFCHGPGLPVVYASDRSPHYTCCPAWQEKRLRELEGKDGLTDPVVPESVSMGVEPEPVQSWEDPDAALRALDELAARRRAA